MSNATPIDQLFDADKRIERLETELKNAKEFRKGLLGKALVFQTEQGGKSTGNYARLLTLKKTSTTTKWKDLASLLGATEAQIEGVTETKTVTEYGTQAYDAEAAANASAKLYAVVDCETTGLDPRHDQIIQLACTLVQGGEVKGSKTWKIRPSTGVPINPDAQAIHGISDEELDGCPVFEEVMDEFIDMVEHAEMIAHNKKFDEGMLSAEFTRLDALESFEIEHCSMEMFRAVLGKAKASGAKNLPANAKLPSLLGFYGVGDRKSEIHDAGEDTQLLALALPQLFADYEAAIS